MTRPENIPLSKSNHQSVPAGVCIIAERDHLALVEELGSTVRLVPLKLTEDLPLGQLGDVRIILLQVDANEPCSLERLDQLQKQYPQVAIIAGLEKVDFATSRALMRRGIDDLVSMPVQPEELLSALTDIAGRLSNDQSTSVRLAPAIAVIKSAGGSGATTFATHLASSLAAQMNDGRRTCIIDCDLQGGDAAAYLGCNPRMTLADLLDPHSSVDVELIHSVVCRANDLIDVIAAPHDILPIEALDFDRLMEIVRLAQQNYAAVILDLPAALSNWAVSLVFAADKIVHVTNLSIATLRHSKRQLDFLESVGLERQNIHVVANRCEKRLFKTIDAGDAAKALGHPVLASVALEGPALGQAQDEGVLIDAVQRRSRFMKDVDAAAARLIESLNGEH